MDAGLSHPTRQEVGAVLEAAIFRRVPAAPHPLRPEARLSEDLGLDSLAIAELVLELEEFTGRDPFRDGFRLFRTVRELHALFSPEAS